MIHKSCLKTLITRMSSFLQNATGIILQTVLQKPLPHKQQPSYHRYHHVTHSGVTYLK